MLLSKTGFTFICATLLSLFTWWGWRWEAESVVIIEDNAGQIGGGGYGSSGTVIDMDNKVYILGIKVGERTHRESGNCQDMFGG
jgi:hypothetical protein